MHERKTSGRFGKHLRDRVLPAIAAHQRRREVALDGCDLLAGIRQLGILIIGEIGIANHEQVRHSGARCSLTFQQIQRWNDRDDRILDEVMRLRRCHRQRFEVQGVERSIGRNDNVRARRDPLERGSENGFKQFPSASVIGIEWIPQVLDQRSVSFHERPDLILR